CAVAIVFMLPAMIAWNDGVRKRREGKVGKLHLQSLGLEHLVSWSARHRGLAIGLTLVATLGSGVLALELGFDESLNSLRSADAPSFKVQQEIADKFGASLSYMMAIAEGSDFDDAVKRTLGIEERLKPFLASGVVGSK